MVPECYNGSGPGCAAEESPLIQEMLERSKANKEANLQATKERYWQTGYKSYFSFYDRDLVKQEDGTYALERPASLIGNTLRSFGWTPPTHGGVPLDKSGRAEK